MLLTTIPGVGFYNALLLVAEIGDVNRFPDSEKLFSYAIKKQAELLNTLKDSMQHSFILIEGRINLL